MHRLAATLAILAGLSGATAGSAAAATDEDQVRAVLDAMNVSYNSADFAGFVAHLCIQMRRADGFEADWRSSRSTDGRTRITVNSVQIRGDDAVANVRFEAVDHDNTLDVEFVRTASGWKACRYDEGRTV